MRHHVQKFTKDRRVMEQFRKEKFLSHRSRWGPLSVCKIDLIDVFSYSSIFSAQTLTHENWRQSDMTRYFSSTAVDTIYYAISQRKLTNQWHLILLRSKKNNFVGHIYLYDAPCHGTTLVVLQKKLLRWNIIEEKDHYRNKTRAARLCKNANLENLKIPLQLEKGIFDWHVSWIKENLFEFLKNDVKGMKKQQLCFLQKGFANFDVFDRTLQIFVLVALHKQKKTVWRKFDFVNLATLFLA